MYNLNLLAQLEQLATIGIKIDRQGDWFAVSTLEDKGVLPSYDEDLRTAVDNEFRTAQERGWL